MPPKIGSAEWCHLLEDLEELQREWEKKIDPLVEGGQLWPRGVHAGIEACRRRMAEESPTRLTQLKALVAEWESIGKHNAGSTEAIESIDGIDFGARLVISRVRRYLRRPARRKPPTSADGSKGPSLDHPGERRFLP